jgi:hypothetical protein
MAALTEATLIALVGKHIRDICTVGYTSDSDNHCAHFVSHVLGYQFGVTCRTMANGPGTPASIRVQDVFSHCLQVGEWDNRPVPLYWGLVFITNARNVNLRTQHMVNVPRKHVGIYFNFGRIYHYSNAHRHVMSQTPEQFSHHYAAPDNAMFWGSAP